MRHRSGGSTTAVPRLRRWGVAARVVLATFVGTAAFVVPVAAEEPQFAPPLAPTEADEAGRRLASTELQAAWRELRRARRVERAAVGRVGPLEQLVAARTAELQALSAHEQEVASQLERARADVRGLAIERYVGGGRVAPLNFVLSAGDATEFARRHSIADSAADAQQAAVDRYAAAREAASILVGEAVVRLEEAGRDLEGARVNAAAATAEVHRLEHLVARRQLLLDLVAAAALVHPSDISHLLLDAYQRAADAMAVRRPDCKVRWTALAAIGRVESNHGRWRGTRAALNGDLWPVILGKPLDGTNNTRHIADTDAGEYDGDSVVDRAVGPMQFIPSTWTRVQLDGNGDGIANPNNVYDATLTAAEYLCRAARAGPLETDEALRPAFFSYNRSEAYVERVLSLSHHYDLLGL